MPNVRASKKAYEKSSKKAKASRIARARKGTPMPSTLSAPVKRAVKKIADRAADRAVPDTVITTHYRTTSNSPISSGDTGYFFAPAGEPIVGGLGLTRRIAAIQEIGSGVLASNVVGSGVRCKSLYYFGQFHISPFAFANNAGVQNYGVNVHCYILSDKFNPLGNAQRDRNCVEDLLVDDRQIWQNNAGNPYRADLVQSMMIPHSGTMYDDNLQVNRKRFKVHHHKVWKIRPTAISNTAVDVDPFNCAAGNLDRKFRFKIPTPKMLKWDRRDLDLANGNADCQTPMNVGDPFVVWGYSTYPNTPDTVSQNLVVDSWTRLRIEVLPNHAA